MPLVVDSGRPVHNQIGSVLDPLLLRLNISFESRDSFGAGDSRHRFNSPHAADQIDRRSEFEMISPNGQTKDAAPYWNGDRAQPKSVHL